MKIGMNENFMKLQERVLDSLERTDWIKTKSILSSIKGPTLVSGVGGSAVVSLFLSKVLSIKNSIICENVAARDLIYRNLVCFKNIISCSYSGNNYGVVTSFDNNLNKYLLSKNLQNGVTNIRYSVTNTEESFISLSSTLIPLSILLAYYLDNDIHIIEDILNHTHDFYFDDLDIYEVLSGYDTSTASKFIESTLSEAGIGIPIIHDKYDYCHGRSTLSHHYNSNLILLNSDSELDQLYDSIVDKYYGSVIKLNRKYDDDIVNDYYFTYLSMYLCQSIANKKKKDLSIVDYSPLVKKIYYFKGKM
ncbi:MAG: hypothetical protein HFJ38_06485 [Bacilli bacterium]|nr:hypothetical protein [Bacilli bacterium]